LSKRRDHRPHEHRLAGGGVPADSFVRLEGRGNVGHRGGSDARGGPRRWGAPRLGVCLARGAGPEVREDLVDHRRLGNEREVVSLFRTEIWPLLCSLASG